MRTQELLKILKKYGIVFERHGTNHDIYYSPVTEKYFEVPRHKAELHTGTLNSILKDTGLK